MQDLALGGYGAVILSPLAISALSLSVHPVFPVNILSQAGYGNLKFMPEGE